MPQTLNAKILNIDDDAAKRYTIGRILAQAGFTVIEASSGAEGIAKLDDNPDLVVLDVKLPDTSGFEIARIIKSRDPSRPIAVLHVSATFVDSEDRARGLDSGADAYLNYPVEADELVATVKALLRLRNAEMEARLLATQWQATFNAIVDGIALLDTECKVTKINKALARLLNIDDRAAVGSSFSRLLERRFGLNSPMDIYEIAQLPERGGIELARFDRCFSLIVDPIDDTGFVCILTDVTQRKRAEDELALTYQREHKIAETLQRSLLLTPSNRLDGMAIETFYEPAWDEASVGGDIFDFFALPDGRTALIVSDAAGKGLAAAACTAEVKFALRAYLSEHLDPISAITRLNGFLTEQDQRSDQTRMIAVALVVVDSIKMEIEVTCAGAEPPVVIGKNGEAKASLCEGDLPLGAFAEADYHVIRYPLVAGDIILMATDGITEARNLRGEFLGHDGMMRLSGKHAGKAELHEMGNAIVNDARSFTGGRFQDDVCLLLARIDSD